MSLIGCIVLTRGGGVVTLGFELAGFKGAFETLVGLAAIGGRGIGAGGGEEGGGRKVGEIAAAALVPRPRLEVVFVQSSSVL